MDAVPLLALPSSGYLFDRWSGDVPDSARLSNPVTVTMDGNKTIQANFRSRAVPPINLAGARYRTGAPPRAAHADILTWEPNRANAVIARYRVYEVRDGARILLTEQPAQVLTFIRRGILRSAARTYAVTTVDDGGDESEAATVSVAAAPRR
jgi:hypothetical protein